MHPLQTSTTRNISFAGSLSLQASLPDMTERVAYGVLYIKKRKQQKENVLCIVPSLWDQTTFVPHFKSKIIFILFFIPIWLKSEFELRNSFQIWCREPALFRIWPKYLYAAERHLVEINFIFPLLVCNILVNPIPRLSLFHGLFVKRRTAYDHTQMHHR